MTISKSSFSNLIGGKKKDDLHFVETKMKKNTSFYFLKAPRQDRLHKIDRVKGTLGKFGGIVNIFCCENE